MGLVSMEGKTLLPFEAAGISKVDSSDENARFVKVVYSTGETTNQDEAFFYMSENRLSLKPSEGDALYKGYAEVFDLVKGQKVKGVRITDGSGTALKDLHEAFAVSQDGATIMYDASGKQLWKGGENVSAYYSSIIDHDNGHRIVIDAAGKERLDTKDNLMGLEGTNGFFEAKDKGESKAVDLDGKQVLEGTYDRISSEAGGMFDVGDGSQRSIVNSKGNVIVKGVSGSLREVVPGVCTVQENNESVLIVSGKQVASGTKNDLSKLLFRDDSGALLVINDGTFGLSLNSCAAIGKGLVCGQGEGSKKYGLYDLFTGKQLLEDKYDVIRMAGDYVFACADGAWTVYKPELKG